MAVVTIRQLLDSGVHFGHQTRRWNPKVKRFILAERSGIHIIDLQQSLAFIDRAYDFVKETVAHGGTILFVGTKKQAQGSIAEQANRVGQPFVNQRWLGGLLTNFQTVSKRLARMKELEDIDFDDTTQGFTKKELLIKKREDFAGTMSGGQRKLLEMARALMADPELVMLDEPMAGVNPALKQSLLGHVKSLRDEGRTVLFVEHDMDMVRDISDWVIVMAQGKVIAEGPPDSVMGDQRVIDAYLGAHHDTDLGDDALLSDEALEEMAAEVAAEKAEREGETA